jgi:hypothetical protein
MARHLYPGLCYFVTPLLSLLWVGTLLEAIQAIIFTLSFGHLSAPRAAINSLLSHKSYNKNNAQMMQT